MIRILISAPNITEGGPLSIMKDLLKEVIKHKNFEIIAIVNSKDLYNDEEFKVINFLEFPDSKKSWFNRIKYEYIKFNKLSREIKPDIWLSMHDITPNVQTKFLVTYCHNSSPFYKFRFKDFLYDKKFGLFNLFYKYLYQINIKKNDFIVVQQNWLKDEFKNIFNINNVIVSKPFIKIDKLDDPIPRTDETIFIYPSLPRVFKNHEIICKAVEHLEKTINVEKLKVYLTIDGSENKYANDLIKKYKHLKNINFIGLKSRKEVFEYYNKSTVLIFPSKLETWGLPISEFKEFKKPLIVSDLGYARETVGVYDKVNFFDPDNYIELANLMKMHLNKKVNYDGCSFQEKEDLIGWPKFIDFIEKKYIEKIS